MSTTNIQSIDFTSECPYSIADKLGIHYSGDMSPIPHNGYFYNLNDAEHGYIEIVEISSFDFCVEIRCATIHIDNDVSNEKIAEEYGIDADELTIHHKIDFFHGYYGAETVADFRGEYKEIFKYIEKPSLKLSSNETLLTLEHGKEEIEIEDFDLSDFSGDVANIIDTLNDYEFLNEDNELMTESDVWKSVSGWIENLRS